MEHVHPDYGNVPEHSLEYAMRIQSESCLCSLTAFRFQVLGLFWSKNRSILACGVCVCVCVCGKVCYSPSCGFLFAWMTFRVERKQYMHADLRQKLEARCDVIPNRFALISMFCLKQSIPHLSSSFSLLAKLSYSPHSLSTSYFYLNRTHCFPVYCGGGQKIIR